MSDLTSHSPPEKDPPLKAGLPSPRSDATSAAAESGEAPQQISLDEMMERLQRSGSSSGSSSSSSGRRRRRSSSSSDHSSSRPRSTSSRSEQDTASSDLADEASASRDFTERSRAMLPPPRRAEKRERTERADRSSRSEKFSKHATPRTRHRLWIYLVGGLFLVVLATWFGIRLLNRWRIEGEGFRVNAARRFSEIADRRISTARFRQTAPYQLSTAALTLQPVRQDLLASAAFTNLTFEFSPGSWLAEDWTVPSLRFSQGDLVFQPDKKLDEQSMWNVVPAPVERAPMAHQGFRLGMTSDPVSVTVEQGRFDQLNLTWPGPAGKPETLTNLLGNFRILDGAVQLDITGGLLDTASWPPFAVHQINARLKGTHLDIVSARLGLTADHEVRLSGSADLTPDGQLSLNADIAPLLLKHLLPEFWVHTVLGNFESNGAVWKSQFKTGPSASLSGPFRVKGWVLRGLPFVDKIANLLRKPDLALLEFPTLTGLFSWTNESTQLTDLNATTADGLLRLRGQIQAVPGERIVGEFTLEANQAYFAGLAEEGTTLFTPSTEGWRSLSFSLGGNAAGVTDNIGIAAPVIFQNRPAPTAIEMPRLTVPPGVSVPAPRPATVSPPVVRPALAPPPNPVRPPPSEAELERQFNALLGR